MFTDDQGYGDLGCFGSTTHETPRLDRLAAEGTRYTSFYAQNVCGPSRSALLTGRYPMRSGGWGMPAEEVTWAELLQGVGYQTACIGKWDVSDRAPIVDRMPLAQGFDFYFGTLAGFEPPPDRRIDGVCQTDLLLGRSEEGARETFVYQAHTSRGRNTYALNGIRKGRWKLLRAEHHVPGYARDTEREEVVELYDLEADLGETNNLASTHPERVAELTRMLDEFELTASED